MKPNPRNYFFGNRVLLGFAGLWQPETLTRFQKILYRSYAILVIIFVNLFFTATEFVSLLETRKDLNDLIKNINLALSHFLGMVKCFFWIFKHPTLLSIIGTLESDDFIYDEVPEKFSQKKIMDRYKFKGTLFTFLFFGMGQMTVISFYVPPLIATARFDGNGTFNLKLPYFNWMPFEYNTPGRYLLALVYQAVPLVSYGYSIVGMDTLFMNMMNFIVAHLLVIQGSFRTIRERCVKRIKGRELAVNGLRDSEELNREMMKEMKKTIKHLQTIYRVRDELENVHKYLTLGQVTTTLFVLCTCLFLVSTTTNPKQLAAEIAYMTAMCFQLVLYCWFGNEVIRAANEIPTSLYESDWLSSSLEFRKCIILTMMRSQKDLVLTAGNFAPLSLDTFVAILKASYSFFAFLQNTN